MDEKKDIDGSTGFQLRSYQLEMLEENMHRNIIVAVRMRSVPDPIRGPENSQDGHRFGQNYDSGGAYQGRA